MDGFLYIENTNLPFLSFGHRQVGRINGKVQEAPLKTKNAYRNISIGADAVSILREKKKQDGGRSAYVFPSPTGGPMFSDSVLHMLHRVLGRTGVPKLRFHNLRHTFATLALQNGVDIKTVSGMLGHFSAGFTLEYLCSCNHGGAEAGGEYHGGCAGTYLIEHREPLVNF